MDIYLGTVFDHRQVKSLSSPERRQVLLEVPNCLYFRPDFHRHLPV